LAAFLLVVEVSLLGDVIEIEGSVSAWFENNRQPQPDGQPLFLKPKSPFLFALLTARQTTK
jgi:hypothetical protein